MGKPIDDADNAFGAPERLAQIFNRHYDERRSISRAGALVVFAEHLCGDRALAEDVVQDVLAVILVKGPSRVLPANVRAYLYTAVRNRMIDAQRRFAAEQRRRLATDPADVSDPPAALDVEIDRESEERGRALEAAWAALPERCRLIMHLRWRAQLSHREIATIAGISVKGVEHQLARGLRLLRAALANDV
jgi:RNA polymerase sigma-70 factor, ECF subfamily